MQLQTRSFNLTIYMNIISSLAVFPPQNILVLPAVQETHQQQPTAQTAQFNFSLRKKQITLNNNANISVNTVSVARRISHMINLQISGGLVFGKHVTNIVFSPPPEEYIFFLVNVVPCMSASHPDVLIQYFFSSLGRRMRLPSFS